ncbi:hypothetical protein FSOLCH5_000654 [Fusarium solani]
MPIFAKRDSSEDGEDGRHTNGANGANGANGVEREDGEHSAPDEHTRLLPNRVNSGQGLLAPDDPAVTPYNLWSIRVLRYLSILFTLTTLVWWVLLLVSTFATPPGIQTRGSVWFAFGYTTWTLANLIFTLIFFEVPSKSVKILAIFMSVRLRSTGFLYAIEQI